MNETEIEIDENRKWFEFRIATLLAFFLVLFIALASRAFQLQILSSDALKAIYMRQNAKTLETRQMIKDLKEGLGKLNTEQTKLIILSAEKAKLLQEINELKFRYNRLDHDIQELQKTLRDLSVLQEKETENLIKMYDRIYRSEKWSSFITSFIMGIVASILASIIYNSAAKKSNMPSMSSFMKIIKDRLIAIKIKYGDRSI